MSKLLVPVLIGVAASALMIVFSFINHTKIDELVSRLKLVFRDLVCRFDFSALFSHFEFLGFTKAVQDKEVELCEKLDLSLLHCRVQLIKQKEDKSNFNAFNVEICGSIHAPQDVHSATLRISIQDITDEAYEVLSVQARIRQWQMPDSSEFCYSAELGKLPHEVTAISDWISIAQLRLDWLELPRKGIRDLLFNLVMLSADADRQLACAQCTFTCENPDFGYMDLQQNVQRVKTLTVALAFAVSAADNKLYDSEIELIKNWARDNINLSETSDKARDKLEKALNETIAFFRDGNKLDTYEICKEIVEIVSVADRYDILNLCLHVAQANGSVAGEELSILKNLATWLEVDMSRFRKMMEKVIPIDMLEVMDTEFVLGVTSDMSREKARKQLNKEYSKWRARVTNTNPEIQSQADQMLKLIAEARSQYVG